MIRKSVSWMLFLVLLLSVFPTQGFAGSLPGKGFEMKTASIVISPPAAPTNLKLASTMTPNNTVVLRWTRPYGLVSGYRVERSTPSVPFWVRVATVALGEETYIDSNLAFNVTYKYRIVAYNMAGPSPASTVVQTRFSQYTPGQAQTVCFLGNSATYYVDGSEGLMDASSDYIGSQMMVSARYISGPFGGGLYYNMYNKNIKITLNGHEIVMRYGSNEAEVDGVTVVIDPSNSSVMPYGANGETMVPVKFISQRLGLNYFYNIYSNRVFVSR